MLHSSLTSITYPTSRCKPLSCRPRKPTRLSSWKQAVKMIDMYLYNLQTSPKLVKLSALHSIQPGQDGC